MNSFRTIAKLATKAVFSRTRTRRRQISAVIILTAVMLPITVPVPIWAYDLNLPPMPLDSGLRLSVPASSFASSALDWVSNLTAGPAALLSAGGTHKAETEAGPSVTALEKRVVGIETELAESEMLEPGQKLSLAARPVDKKGGTVNGLAAKWQCANPKVVRILNDSEAVAVGEGETNLLVRSGNTVKEIAVRVKRSPANRNISAAPLPEEPEQPVLTEQQVENLVTPENNLGSPVGQTEMASRSSASALRTRERYGSSNYSFDIPVVSLPGRGLNASVGITYNSRLWNKSGDAVNGRTFTFNTDNSWLAPGFEMGFGEMTSFGTSFGNGIGYMLAGPDGTRHQLLYKQASGQCAIYESTDGTFVQTTICGIYTTSTINVVFPDGSQILYGTVTASGKRFPINVTDRNGNMLTIAYVQNDSQGKIASIRDTLNRYINFHYETASPNRLVTITAPGYDSGAERQVIRFYYENLTLSSPSARFDGTVVAPTTPFSVLKYVYFPGTQTGFRYDYTAQFGMIYKIWQLRGMQVSPTGLNETGSVTNDISTTEPIPSMWAAWTNYDYPLTPQQAGLGRTEVPTYTTRTDDWKGRTAATAAQTHFGITEMVTPSGCEISSGGCTGDRTVTVTAPDGSRSISVSLIKPTGDWKNGLLDETRIENGTGEDLRVWSKTKLFWAQGAGSSMPGRDNPRLEKIEVTNDSELTKATTFENYDDYNNARIVREYDYAAPGSVGAELKRTETTYETGADWINNRLLRLPKEVKTVVGTNTVSKIAFEYDNNGASLTTSNIQYRTDISGSVHSLRYNPSAPSGSGCATCPPQYQYQCCWSYNAYQPHTRFRGNVTKVIAFPDTSKPATDPGNSVTTMKYDITGNVVESSGGCGCEVKTMEYSNANNHHYAYPVSETRSGTNVPSLTTSATYDVPTGLVRSVTDENDQTTTLTYDPASLRLERTDGPAGTGIWTETDYNDSTYPYHVKTTQSLDATRSVSGWAFFNGRGQQFRARSQTAGGFLSSEMEFDIMGRPEKSFNPHTVATYDAQFPGGVPFSAVTQRDGLGRSLVSTGPEMPIPTTVSTYFSKQSDFTGLSSGFNKTFVVVTDQASKKRRQFFDALGRIVRVDEPDSDGNLPDIGTPAVAQKTEYGYDGNDNLTTVIQSDGTNVQERKFKYDALSRLTHEKQVEATATLNDAGDHVGPGGTWTGFYKFDNQSLLEYGVEARNVRTTFVYDKLKRVKTVTFSGEPTSGPNAYQTPTATYTYDETESGFYNLGRLTKVQTAENVSQGTPATVHNYRYDKLGQMKKHVQSIGNQTYELEYGYNLAGQLVSEKYPSGKVVTMGLDDFGRLNTVSDATRTYVSGVTFNDKGLLSQINLGNGTHETFGYSPDRLQMTSQSLMKGAEVLQKYVYSYGAVDLATGNVNAAQNNGQLSKVEGWIGGSKQWSKRFGYDSHGRLKEAREYKQGDNGQLTYKQVFDYDRFGNLYRKQANNPTSGQQNPLPYIPIEEATTPGTGDIEKTTNRFRTETTYDAAGHVIADDKFRDMSFAYDANGRQVKATRIGVADAWTVYDALGDRVATKINDIWQYVIYDAFGKVVAEYGQLADGLGGVEYIQQDWQGSVRAVTNANGFVVARTDHQAFGGEVGYGVGLRSIEQGYNVEDATRQGYGLTERDEATGLDHTWFRKNENAAGRWTSPDPYKGSMSMGNPQSFNRYSYVGNDPLNYVDPTGLCLFFINILIDRRVKVSQDVLDGAKAEIRRIFNAAGHSVTFSPSSKSSATYNTTLLPGISPTNFNRLGYTNPGTNIGGVMTGKLTHLGVVQNTYNNAGPEGFSSRGQGLGLGRVLAHEAITHYLLRSLGTNSSEHSGSQLTRAIFEGSTLFKDETSNRYDLNAAQAAELRKYCEPVIVPNNIAGGGGGGGDSFGHIGGGGYPWWYYSTWAFANWVSSIRIYHTDVRIVDEEEEAGSSPW